MSFSADNYNKKLVDVPVNKQDNIQPSPSLSELRQNLGLCLSMIDDEIMKGCVTRLEQLPIKAIDSDEIRNLKDMHFFKATELVYQGEDFSVDKFAMAFSTLSGLPCTVALLVKSSMENTDFYIGVRPNGENSAGTLLKMLKSSFMAFFPGSRTGEYYGSVMRKDMDAIRIGSISSVTCIADYKHKKQAYNDKSFVQGLEKFIYAMQGKEYTAVFLADSAGYEDLMARKREYCDIYSQISPFADMQINFAESSGNSTGETANYGEGVSIAEGTQNGLNVQKTITEAKTNGIQQSVAKNVSDTFSTGTNESTSDSTSKATGTSDSTTRSVSDGISSSISNTLTAGLSLAIPELGGLFGGLARTAMQGMSHTLTNGSSHTESLTETIGKTITHGTTQTKSHQTGTTTQKGTNSSISVSNANSIGQNTSQSKTETHSINWGGSKSKGENYGNTSGITLNRQDMALNLTLQRIKKHLDRIEECESVGMWNFAAYFLGESMAETQAAAGAYKAIMSGEDTCIEHSAINTWTNPAQLKTLQLYVKNFCHPKFEHTRYGGEKISGIVTPATLVSTNELAMHIGLPRHSVKGLPVIEYAQFAQQVITHSEYLGQKIRLGNVYHLGQNTGTELSLDMESLAMHTFITGSTGSGKTNTVCRILDEARLGHIPFLVIEPAKGEYKNVFKKCRDILILGTNQNISGMELLRINPFSFPKSVHVLEHIDRIVEVFNVCWPMYAAMPAILKDSIERAYAECGWDLEKSSNKYETELFPSFADVLEQIKIVLAESEYSADNKGDYTGALSTRLRSLTNGINGLIFQPDEISPDILFDKSCIVDLSRIGSSETKSLIMGLLVIKMQEWRMEKSLDCNNHNGLKHLTVLEEAHNLLKRSLPQSGESSGMQAKSVEMLSNSIAEMRAYGEGFIIADQAPGLLDMSAIRNTNTKIILRLPDYSDRQLAGKAAGLNEEQIEEIARLEKGIAAVSQNDWAEPVLCQVERHNPAHMVYGMEEQNVEVPVHSYEAEKLLSDYIMARVQFPQKLERKMPEYLLMPIMKSRLSSSIKCAFMDYINSDEKEKYEKLRRLAYRFFHMENAVGFATRSTEINEWSKTVLQKLRPSVLSYTRQQQNKLFSLLICELALKEKKYENIFTAFVEKYKKDGFVF